MYNVLNAIIQAPKLNSILRELTLEAINELDQPAVGLAAGEGEGAVFSTFSRIISIKNAKIKGYFSAETKEETIRNWIKNGTIPESCVKKIGRRYFFREHSLTAWLLGEKSKFESKGGEEKAIKNSKNKEASMWSQPQEKTGRCRLSLGANCYLISDPLRNGKESFRIEYLDSEKRRLYLRLKKSVITTRERAVAQASREIERMEKIGRIANSYSRETVIPNVAGDYQISQVADKFLYAKKRENIRSFNILRTAIENRIVPFFGNIPMSRLTIGKIKDYVNERRKEVKDVSIKNDLISLRTMYGWAKDEKIYTDPHPVKIKKLHLNVIDRERYMTPEEEQKIWKVMENQPILRDLATFILNVSMRNQNILDLTWDRISFDKQEAFVPADTHKQKDHDGHYLLNTTILDLLEKLKKKSSKSKYVFHFPNGKKIGIKWVQRNWRATCEKAGVEDLHFYDLKATCLTRMAGKKEINPFILQHFSNHSSLNSLQKYIRAAGLREKTLEVINGVK